MKISGLTPMIKFEFYIVFVFLIVVLFLLAFGYFTNWKASIALLGFVIGIRTLKKLLQLHTVKKII